MALKLVTEATGIMYAPPEEIYGSKSFGGGSYPRVIELHHAGRRSPGSNAPVNGTLLASFEEPRQKDPVFPIFRSDDHGLSWYRWNEVVDTKNGWGNKYQPHLFEYPCQLGEFPAGTIMISGNSIPEDRSSTEIVCYISRDHGATWEYLSTVVKGGKANTDEADWDDRPVWEPYLCLDKNGDLVCYYSDERFRKDGHNQLLSYQVSKDGGKTWGEEVYNVALGGGVMRPGMPIVQKMANGRYIMTYEQVGLPRCDLYFKTSDDGLDWGDPADYGTRCETVDGKYMGSTPYCLWVPQGGPNGTIIASAKRDSDGDGYRNPSCFMVNYNNGEGPWEIIESGISFDARSGATGYSQGMCLIQSSQRLLHLCPVQMSPSHSCIAYCISRLETV